MSKPLIDKASGDDSSIYYGNHLPFLNNFLSHIMFEFHTFITFYLQIFPVISIKIFKVYNIFLISVFATSNIINLNLLHKSFDVNNNHLNCKTFLTEVLDMNRLDITTVKWQKCYVYILTRTTANIYIFRKIIGQNLQRIKENWNNIKFY